MKHCPKCGRFMAFEQKIVIAGINLETGHKLLAQRDRERCAHCGYCTPLRGGDFAMPNGYGRFAPRG